MLRRFAFSTVAVLFLYVAAAVEFPIKRSMLIQPGTAMGFEYSEDNLFEFLRIQGTVDCVYYSFNSTQPLNAALYFQHLSYIKEYFSNHTTLPVDRSVIPNSMCNQTKSCTVDFPEGMLPKFDSRLRSERSTIPYTVGFSYDLNNTEPANVTLVVDAPCYTGENETYVFPAPPVPVPVPIPTNVSHNNQSQSS